MQQNRSHYSEKKLTPSREEYLKAIYRLSERTELVRSIEIAEYLGVSRPSVHNAVTRLQQEGMVIKPLGGAIQLTEEGRKKGEIITAKFRILRYFLNSCCNVSEPTASADACKMEHIISNESIFALKKSLDLEHGNDL